MVLFNRQEFEKIKESFAKIKGELDEHLEAINQTTNELQSTYEYVCKLGKV